MLKIANQTHYHKAHARELVDCATSVKLKTDLVLNISDTDISLCLQNASKLCFTHSFTEGKLKKRAQQKNQGLIKACNNKKNEIKHILDLTAGWGKDSFILASQGFEVDMVEQNRLIASCLNYLIEIAKHDSNESFYQNIQVHRQDGLSYLAQHSGSKLDCVYLDPMFPAHKSSAKPSKDLQLLQLLTENCNMELLFNKALKLARFRVVVKRPLHAPTLTDLKPDIVYKEKTIRFDVYITHNR